MNWFNKLPNSVRYASGLEWKLWRKLPLIFLVGTALPVAVLGVMHWMSEEDNPAELRRLQLADYIVTGVVIFHWTLVFTAAFGCIVVMLMKGPGYVADALEVSHSDRPRAEHEDAPAANDPNGPQPPAASR